MTDWYQRTVGFLLILVGWLWLGPANTAVSQPQPQPSPPDTLFQDISRAAGLVNTRQGDDRAIGLAWGDYNGNGWQDLYVTDTDGPNTLFRNNGDGTFSRSPLTDQVALPDAYSGGATFVDYDNDGWPDLYVVNWGENVLFRNMEGQGFVDVTAEAGIGDPANGQSAAWGDITNNGYLDLYVANWACYPRCGRQLTGESDRLYRNNGDGTFTDITHVLSNKILGSGFIASFVDYNNNGRLDIYLVNDEFINAVGNALWRNDGPGCGGWCFTDVSAEANANTRVMGMGLAIFDYENNGHFDFFFTNAGPMTLLQNQGDGTFVNQAVAAGVQFRNGIAWGAAPIDFDNDGWQDLYLAVMGTGDGRGVTANPLWRNNGDGTFELVHTGSGAGAVGPSMGIATADFDQDGWVDLLVGDAMLGYSLYRNQGAAFYPDHHWLSLRLIGGGPVNRDAVGTRVLVHTADGQTQMQEVRNGVSLGAGSELALHFGLGRHQAADITVIWPNGRSQEFSDVAANRRIELPYPLDADTETAQLLALYPPIGTASGLALPALNFSLSPTLLVSLGLLLAGLFWLLGGQRLLARPGLLEGSVLVLGLLLGAWLVVNGRSYPPPTPQPPAPANPDTLSLDQLLALAGATLPQQLPQPPEAQVRLGEALFWDPLLSGNRDISCATCHHPNLATGDGLSVSIGTGGTGLGLARQPDGNPRRDLVPRNATSIFNLGLVGLDVMFWDGRASGTAATGFRSPADDDLPFTLENLVAVQAMFPVTSREEMRGNRGDRDIFGERNELAQIDDHDFPGMWDGIMTRLLAVPEYVDLFAAAYPETPATDLDFSHAANAMAAYQMATFTFLDSPWDRYLQGETDALAPDALAGAHLFYGRAGCADCHSGPLLTDLQFYNLGVPQIGAGKGREQPFDFGRARETGYLLDMYAFRTPPLRNVAITGPWMHNGAFTSLETAVRHHFEPLPTYDESQLTSLMQATVPEDPAVCHIAASAPSLAATTPPLTDAEVNALLAFLHALTSPSALDLEHTIPERVPSGLPVDR